MLPIQIGLPNKKCVYEFMNFDIDEKIKVLEIGISAIKLINEKKLRYDNSEFNEKLNENEEKYKAIIQTFKKQLNDKINENEDLKESFINREQELQKNIKNTIELQFTEKMKDKDFNIQSLKDEISNNRAELNELNEKHFINERERTDILHKNYQKNIDKLRTNYNEKMEEITNRIFKSEENSSIKGKLSENAMFQNLNMLFPKNTIEDTHKEAGRGDFIMIDSKNNKIMFENKDYSKNVPKKEIDKFKRDLENNNDIWAAVLMSNASGICNKSDYCIEPVGEKLAIYLHNTNKDINKIKNAYDILCAINNANIDFANKEIIDKLTQNSSEFKRKISKSRKDLDKFYKSMIDNILDIENLTKNTFEEIKIEF